MTIQKEGAKMIVVSPSKFLCCHKSCWKARYFDREESAARVAINDFVIYK
jgi:hypothetical protein